VQADGKDNRTGQPAGHQNREHEQRHQADDSNRSGERLEEIAADDEVAHQGYQADAGDPNRDESPAPQALSFNSFPRNRETAAGGRTLAGPPWGGPCGCASRRSFQHLAD
jgi:hypothetical protein